MPERREIYLHGFCDDWPSPKGRVTDVFSRFQSLAVSELARRGKVNKVGIDLKCVQENGQVVGEAMAKAIRSNSGYNLEKYGATVDFEPLATTTRQETKGFIKMAGGQEFVVMTIAPHVRRARRALIKNFGEKGKDIPILTPEEVLTKERPQRYKKLVANIVSSRQYRGMERREALLNKIDSVPVMGTLVLQIGDKILRNKKLEAWTVKFLSRF